MMIRFLHSWSRLASRPARRRTAPAIRPTLDALEARDLRTVLAGIATAKSAYVGLLLPSLRPTAFTDPGSRVGMITPALRFSDPVDRVR